MDLIDRQAAIRSVCEKERRVLKPCNAECGSIIALRELPSVEAVEVVRCKDCKWYDPTHPYGTIVADAFHCKVNDRFYKDSHFCGYGERRESDG